MNNFKDGVDKCYRFVVGDDGCIIFLLEWYGGAMFPFFGYGFLVVAL